MSNSITLDNQPFEFTEAHLPCLVNGIEGSGASNFSIELAAELIRNNKKVIFFTAFPMAKAKLMELVDHDQLQEINSEIDIHDCTFDKTLLVNSGDLALLSSLLNSVPNIQEYIIFVKNIEAYDNLSAVIWSNSNRLLLSGAVDDCQYKPKLLEVEWTSQILFSASASLSNVSLPKLEKYECYLSSAQATGILRLTPKQ